MKSRALVTTVHRLARRRGYAQEAQEAPANFSADVVPPPPPVPSISTSGLLVRDSRHALATPDLTFMDGGQSSGRVCKEENLLQSIRSTMRGALARDPTSTVFGEDVAFGGVFRCTQGLRDEFGPTRVFNTPLSEQGIVGFGIGQAVMGHKAIAEIQFADYIFPAFDQIVNEACKYRFRSAGQYNCGGLTIRAPSGCIGHGGVYHSQSTEAYFLHAAGARVVVPRSPIQAKGLLNACIEDPNPCIFFEPKILYRAIVESVPEDDFTLPLGKAEVVREGTDVTIVSYGTPLYTIEQALHILTVEAPKGIDPLLPKNARNVSAEVIDLRTVHPYDFETVERSVRKTGRLIVVTECAKTGSVASEICADVAKRCFWRLKAPSMRVTSWDSPYTAQFEFTHIPSVYRIIDAIEESLAQSKD